MMNNNNFLCRVKYEVNGNIFEKGRMYSSFTIKSTMGDVRRFIEIGDKSIEVDGGVFYVHFVKCDNMVLCVNYFKSSSNYHFVIGTYYFITSSPGGFQYEVRNADYIFCGMVDKKMIEKNFIIYDSLYSDLEEIFNNIMDNYE